MEEFITKAKDMRSKKARALSLARWKSMRFSADGQSILISTDANLVLTLHAFEGDVKQVRGWVLAAVVFQAWCCCACRAVASKLVVLLMECCPPFFCWCARR